MPTKTTHPPEKLRTAGLHDLHTSTKAYGPTQPHPRTKPRAYGGRAGRTPQKRAAGGRQQHHPRPQQHHARRPVHLP